MTLTERFRIDLNSDCYFTLAEKLVSAKESKDNYQMTFDPAITAMDMLLLQKFFSNGKFFLPKITIPYFPKNLEKLLKDEDKNEYVKIIEEAHKTFVAFENNSFIEVLTIPKNTVSNDFNSSVLKYFENINSQIFPEKQKQTKARSLSLDENLNNVINDYFNQKKTIVDQTTPIINEQLKIIVQELTDIGNSNKRNLAWFEKYTLNEQTEDSNEPWLIRYPGSADNAKKLLSYLRNTLIDNTDRFSGKLFYNELAVKDEQAVSINLGIEDFFKLFSDESTKNKINDACRIIIANLAKVKENCHKQILRSLPVNLQKRSLSLVIRRLDTEKAEENNLPYSSSLTPQNQSLRKLN